MLSFVTASAGSILQSTFRRLYATIPETAAVARTASTPRAVRLRRLRKQPIGPGESDITPEGLTPTEVQRYRRALAKGELMQEDGTTLTESQWLEKLDSRRSRIRGVREVVGADGVKETRVVGRKIYLPNIIMRLVRNYTPPGQPYNPYEATFRVPPSMTKTDIRSYLSAVYGVKSTYIRTDNYISPLSRDMRTTSWTRTRSYRTYKRAVVGLVDPFYYPQAIEDMTSSEREERLAFLEEELSAEKTKRDIKTIHLQFTRSSSSDWKWRTGTTANRGNIKRMAAERRTEREQAIADAKARMQESRRANRAIEGSES